MSSATKKIILICSCAFFLVLLLSILISVSLSSEYTESFNHDSNNNEENITQEQRNEEYEIREELPDGIQETLESLITGQLSAGKFTDLDMRLKELSDTYKDNIDQSNDEKILIDNYRADIAFYLSLVNNKALDYWYFNNPETLAAAVAYSHISVKYKAFINLDSAVLPPATEDILLRKADYTSAQYKEILDSINEQRTDNAKFQSVAIYNMKILGYSCQLIEVRDMQSYAYQPYALVVDDPLYTVTSNVVNQMLQYNPDMNIDNVFAAPTSTE